MKYRLLSHTINENTPLYGDTPLPLIVHTHQISRGDSNNTAIFSVHNHTGTHIDAPKHFIDNGKPISKYSLDELIFKHPVMIDCPKDNALLITQDDLQQASHLLQISDCLLLQTGFGEFRNEKKYRTQNPGIAPETILWIRKEYQNIRCIGIDTISISSFQHRDAGRKAHITAFKELDELGEPLLLIEDMKLGMNSRERFGIMFVFPWQIEGLDSVPCTILMELE